MKTFTKIFGVLLLSEMIFAVHADAARTSHRPWLAKSSRSSSSSLEADRTAVERAAPASKGDRIAQQAKRYKGTRYKFGGTSKRGLDCSGLVQRIYNDLNFSKVPRTSGQLYKMGDTVHMNELRPGDLVFFKNTYKRGISHVGVYAGNNRFIHAQNKRHGVTVTSLADPYYQLHYAGARRLY